MVSQQSGLVWLISTEFHEILRSCQNGIWPMPKSPPMDEGRDDVALSTKDPQGTRHSQKTLEVPYSPTEYCGRHVRVSSPEETLMIFR